MGKKVIYGLGKNFKKNQQLIAEWYPDITFCDANEEKRTQYENYISIAELRENINEYEKIIITFVDAQKIVETIEILGAKVEQITLLDLEIEQKSFELVHYYGEGNVDALLDTLLLQIGKDLSNIKYLEIGTNNPISRNNSYHLYRDGSRGILVDPLPAVKKLVELFRPEDNLIQEAIIDVYDQNEISFYIDKDISSGISSVLPDHYQKWGGKEPKEIRVKACHIATLLENIEFLPDILFIDAEGLDNRLIRAIPFFKYRISVILVEIIDMNRTEYKDFVGYMCKQGYELYNTVAGINSIFVHTDDWNNRLNK